MRIVRDAAKRAMGDLKPLEGPLAINARFVFEPPSSWSRKKRDSTQWKSSKGDLDNYVKLLLDCLGRDRICNGSGRVVAIDDAVFIDDAQVASMTVQKCYGVRAEVIVTVSQLGGEAQA
jgi:Holliday junction resolvase RusA-like endonuclease